MSSSVVRGNSATTLVARYLAALLFLTLHVACGDSHVTNPDPDRVLQSVAGHQRSHVERGRAIFRFDTFGNEPFWTDTLRLHEVIQTAVDPLTALAVGLKVDAAVLPDGILDQVDLTDPATTVALLGLNAVVGVQAVVTDDNRIERFGITCALCHTDVDDSVLDGIGNRLDGWPNRDLNVGAIVALSPALPDETKAILNSWGPGRYDAYLSLDGINDPVLIPPAYGLRGVGRETYSGEGPISYWNGYVAVTQMHGQGSFSDPRLGIDIVASPDLVTPKLPALRAYQLSLDAPKPPSGSYDRAAAKRGRKVFFGRARCGTCHVPPTFSDARRRLHDPALVGTDPLRATRGTTGRYRATPLRGVWQRAPYFHDGSATALADVVAHYDRQFGLALTSEQAQDLVEFLKSL